MAKKDVSLWVPDPPVRLRVVGNGWPLVDLHCPHCKKQMTPVFARALEFIDYIWLCSCENGDSIEEWYKKFPGEHVLSLGYYLNCAWKIQEGVWQ